MTDLDRLNKYVAEKLRADGFGGLCCADEVCGCELDDLMVCDSPSPLNCRPGYKHECDLCPRTAEDCPVENGHTPGGCCIWSAKDIPEALDD